MSKKEEAGSLFSDGVEAVKLVCYAHSLSEARLIRQVFRLTWRRNIVAWAFVPFGIIIILLACFGLNSLIRLSSVQYPASVACLVLLFFGLLSCDQILGERKTREIVNIIDVPVR